MTQDTRARFHACERWNRCCEIENCKEDVVYIDTVDIGRVMWEIYFSETKAMIMKGERVTKLVGISYTGVIMIGLNDVLFEQLLPLTRHSPLPELKSLVALFRPKRVVPNELYPSLFGLDYACMPTIFGPCLQPGGAELIHEDIRTIKLLKPNLWENLVIDFKDVQAERVPGTAAEELVRLVRSWNEPQPDHVLEDPGMCGSNVDILGWLFKYLPAEFANQLRANLKARYLRGVRDAPMRVGPWGEDSSQTTDGESQDESWLVAHFLPEAAHQPLPGLSSSIPDEEDVSRAISESEETVVSESTVISSVPDSGSGARAAIPPPHPTLDGSVPIFGPQFESSAPPRRSVVNVKDDQGGAPSAHISSKKRLRDPEPPDVPSKRRAASSAFGEEDFSPSAASPSVAISLQSSSSTSQKQPRQFHKASTNTSSSPSVYVSPKLERKARHLGFKGEAEIQNLAAMREKLRAMTSIPMGVGDKPEYVPDKPGVGSSGSHSKNGPKNAESEPGRSLKKELTQDIKDERSTPRLRCIGSQSQGL